MVAELKEFGQFAGWTSLVQELMLQELVGCGTTLYISTQTDS